ncbi:MAG: hypothetical protein N3A66_07855 [Planctomycetota bacterium]|nr:hypothetical protein [Planctomycetota bacterium]
MRTNWEDAPWGRRRTKSSSNQRAAPNACAAALFPAPDGPTNTKTVCRAVNTAEACSATPPAVKAHLMAKRRKTASSPAAASAGVPAAISPSAVESAATSSRGSLRLCAARARLVPDKVRSLMAITPSGRGAGAAWRRR